MEPRLSSGKLLLIFLLLVQASCHNPASPTPEGPHVRGKITDWFRGDTIVAVAIPQWPATTAKLMHVLGTSAIDKDGNFDVPLSAPAQNLLYPDLYMSRTLSDTAAKFLKIYTLSLRRPDGTYSSWSLMNGTVSYETFYSDSSKPGDYLAYFVYADRDVEMTGLDWTTVAGTGKWVHIQHRLSYKKGWNRILLTVLSNQPQQIDLETTVVNATAGNWYLEVSHLHWVRRLQLTGGHPTLASLHRQVLGDVWHKLVCSLHGARLPRSKYASLIN